MDSVVALLSGLGLAWILFILVVFILYLILPFFVMGIYSEAKKTNLYLRKLVSQDSDTAHEATKNIKAPVDQKAEDRKIKFALSILGGLLLLVIMIFGLIIAFK